MKISRNQLACIIKDAKPDRFSLPSEISLAACVAKELKIEVTVKLKEIMKKELIYYKRNCKTYGDTTFIVDSDDFPMEACPPAAKVRKSLSDVTRRQVLRRTDKIWEAVTTVAAEENILVHQLLGLLLTRCGEQKIIDTGDMLWKNEQFENCTKIPLNTALTIYADSALGRETYTNQRKLLTANGFNFFPAWGKLRKKQREITPEAQQLPDPRTGVYFHLISAIKTTAAQIIPNLLEANIADTAELKLKIKFGFDGSGSHAIYNQVNNVQTNNIVMTMFCPLSIENSDASRIWNQESPNAAKSQRPIALQMGKESHDNLQYLSIFNEDIAFLREVGFDIEGKNIKTEIQSYLFDRKAADLYLGLGGAYCDLCTFSKDQCIDVDLITAGFNINREIETLHEIFTDLEQEDGTVLKRRNDYDVRQGVTHKPIATNSVKSSQVLHALLRTFDHFMKIAVHLKAEVFDWSESPLSMNKQFLDDAKSLMKAKIFDKTGRKWDCPDKTGKGGTTTDGNCARHILHHNREIVVSEVPDRLQDVLRHYGQQLSVIVRVMSSKEKVNIERYKQCCTDLYVFLINNFQRVINKNLPGPWISITPSLHKLLAHTWELIEINDGVGLGALDEAGLEGCNKILRGIRTKLSRKTSQHANLMDTLRRMWVASDPMVNAERKKSKPFCKLCSTTGHSSRYCELLKASEDNVDDALFERLTTV